LLPYLRSASPPPRHALRVAASVICRAIAALTFSAAASVLDAPVLLPRPAAVVAMCLWRQPFPPVFARSAPLPYPCGLEAIAAARTTPAPSTASTTSPRSAIGFRLWPPVGACHSICRHRSPFDFVRPCLIFAIAAPCSCLHCFSWASARVLCFRQPRCLYSMPLRSRHGCWRFLPWVVAGPELPRVDFAVALAIVGAHWQLISTGPTSKMTLSFWLRWLRSLLG